MAKKALPHHSTEFPTVVALKERRVRLVAKKNDLQSKLNNMRATVDDDARSLLEGDGGVATAVTPSVEVDTITKDLRRHERAIGLIDADIATATEAAKKQIRAELQPKTNEAYVRIAGALVELFHGQQALNDIQRLHQERGATLPSELLSPLAVDPYQQSLRLPQQAQIVRDYRSRLRFIANNIPAVADEIAALIKQIES